MAKDKQQPEQTGDQQLEAKVDAMMDPKRPEPTFVEPREESTDKHQEPAAGQPNDTLPPLDIFSDPKTAPEVPKDLLKDIGTVEEAPKKEEVETTDQPPAPEAEPELDDATSDAAIDEIVAKESDTVLATEDASAQAASEEVSEAPKKLHHHPLFWSFVAIVAILAIVAAYILANGGNQLPGTGRVQSWWHAIQRKV
ncbi:MAG TPA: hypothetical protein VLG13_02995 [Patescibacteria group bacterium]|nr:hypothetical protein [Patescibacteria group bacterium]